MSTHFESLETTIPENLHRLPTEVDTDFQRLIEFIKDKDVDEIKKAIIRNLNHFNKTNPQLYRNSINYYNDYNNLWGKYYPEEGNYELVDNRADALVNHLEDFKWLYPLLKDYRSKKILVNILYYWLMSDPKRIEGIYDRTYRQYFDLDIVKCDENEVFVDIGGYIGDSIVDYTRAFGKDCYKRIYSYEIVSKNIEYIEKNVKLFELDNIIINKKGAGSKNGTMYISSDDISSINQLAESGKYAIPVVKIDDDIEEDVTFIKMDIEGGEEEALLGCIQKIKDNHPKLALSIYHNHKDMWKLPRIIYDADPTYNFYIRYYGSSILPTEYVIYAI